MLFIFVLFIKMELLKRYKKDSLLRKPNIGMFRLAAKKMGNIDKKRFFFNW
jgi:hypothetical protein